MSIAGAARRDWVVAASIGIVEALKDQLGVCRWNNALRSIQQQAKASVRSYYCNHLLPASSSSSSSQMMTRDMAKIKRTEESLMRVMDLSCWGPSTVRF